MFDNLKEKFIQLFDIFFLPSYKKKNSSFNLFSIIYYRFNLQKIKKACDEIRASLNSYTWSYHEQYLINHENFKVGNFYQTLPPTLDEVDELLVTFNENFDTLSTDECNFISHFSILKTFYIDIQNKGFTSDEYNELAYSWSVLFLKGFALSQIDVKLSEEEYSEKKAKFSNIEYEKYCNLCWRIEFSHINEKFLNQLFQKYSKSKLRGILAPFIQISIPHFKSLITPESFIWLTLDKSKEY